jgi:hypothetical protein
MSDSKIARFVGIEACKSIFSEKSTFVLRSPEHYRRLYETSYGAKGDRNEGCADTVDGGTAEFTSFVVSCWTRLDATEPSADEWAIFKKNEQNIVAIVSTPSKVCEFLDMALETNNERPERRFPFHPVRHKEVNYGPVNRTNNADVVPFTKDAKFAKEKEYRFVLYYARYPHVIDSYIFCAGVDYMEKFFVNPEIGSKEKQVLCDIIGNAMAGYGDFTGKKKMSDIIANVDVLYDW